MKTVADILSRKGNDVASIGRDATVVVAARLMNERKIGSLVVTEGDKVVGIFTERDVLIRVVAEERSPAKCRVCDVMTTPVACCNPATALDECRGVMRARRIRHLPVVDDGRLQGMISIGDLNQFDAVDQAETIQYLSEYLYGRA